MKILYVLITQLWGLPKLCPRGRAPHSPAPHSDPASGLPLSVYVSFGKITFWVPCQDSADFLGALSGGRYGG